jgi:hypothetical protein
MDVREISGDGDVIRGRRRSEEPGATVIDDGRPGFLEGGVQCGGVGRWTIASPVNGIGTSETGQDFRDLVRRTRPGSYESVEEVQPMRTPRVEFSLPRLLAMATVLAVALHAMRVYRAYLSYRERARGLRRNEASSAETLARLAEAEAGYSRVIEVISAGPRGAEKEARLADWRGRLERTTSRAEQHRRVASHNRLLREKYEAAMRRPWRVVEPDPPPPE